MEMQVNVNHIELMIEPKLSLLHWKELLLKWFIYNILSSQIPVSQSN